MEIHLFENSLDFILSGIRHVGSKEDYNSLKYAVVHLSSGLELLLKERLRLVNWSLIFNKVDEASEGKYNSGDFISIYLDSAIKRLEGICGIKITESDKGVLRAFKKMRNTFEHFKVIGHEKEISGLSVKVVSFILEFIKNNFNSDSFSVEAHGYIEDIQEELQKFDALYEEHSNRILEQNPEIDNLARVDCPICYRDFLVLGDGNPRCYYCFYKGGEPSNVASEYIENIMGISAYVCGKEGGEFPQYFCPDCGSQALVYNAEASDVQFTCFACGEQHDNNDLRFCSSCGEIYYPDSEEDSLCSDCWDNIVNRD